jgi:hypothetical protein
MMILNFFSSAYLFPHNYSLQPRGSEEILNLASRVFQFLGFISCLHALLLSAHRADDHVKPFCIVRQIACPPHISIAPAHTLHPFRDRRTLHVAHADTPIPAYFVSAVSEIFAVAPVAMITVSAS